MTRFFAILLTAIAFARLGAAQTTVSGRVYNSDGKTEVAGAIVKLDNPAIGLSRTVRSDARGGYIFEAVPPASGYDIEAVVNGKTVARRAGIPVLVGQARTVFPPLIRDYVEPARMLNRSALQVNLSSSDSENITRRQLRALPLFDRTFLALGLLSPGVHNIPAGSPLAGATFSISGGRPGDNNFLLDGTDNVASSSNQAIPFQVNDSIQEFRVIYSNAPAEYGRGSGGVIDVVTSRGRRHGGEPWHGGTFGFFSSDALNSGTALSAYSNSTFEQALLRSIPSPFDLNPKGNFSIPTASAFSTQSYSFSAPHSYQSFQQLLSGNCMACGQPFNASSILAANDSHTQPLNQKQFGLSAGGPLTEKIFLFGGYEGTLIDNPNQIFERAPTAFDKSLTNFPSLASNASAQFAQRILQLFPAPNVVGVPGVLEFFKGQAPNFTHVHNLLHRADYVASENATYLFRYNAQILDQLHDDTLPVSAAYPGNGADRKAQNQSLTINQIYSAPRGWVSNARLGVTQFRLRETPQDAGFNATSLGLPGAALPTFILSGIDPSVTSSAPGTKVGQMGGWFDSLWNGPNNPTPITPSLDGLFPFARLGAPFTAPSQRRDTQGFAADSVAMTKGGHHIKLGGEYHYLQNIAMDGGVARGVVVSNNIGEFTHDSETCVSCGLAFQNPSFDYALRQPAQYAGDLRSWTLSGFIEDRFHLRRNLVIEAGVRYDFFSQPREQNGGLFNFDPAANGLVRQGGSQVVDPFGFPCAGGNLQMDALPNFVRAQIPVPWTCNSQGTGLPEPKHTNFAPRFGVAYSPAEGKTVLRAGAGIFYNQSPVDTTAQLLQNRPTPLNLSNPSAIYGQSFNSPACPISINQFGQCGFGNTGLNPATVQSPFNFAQFQAASSPGAIYALDTQNASTPYTVQFNGGIEQQLGRRFLGQLAYIGARGFNQPVLHNTNFQDELFCTSSANNKVAGNCDNISYFPIFTLSNLGSSSYNSLAVKLRMESWHGLSVNGAYTWSHSYDNASSGQFPLVPSTIWNQLFGFQLDGLGSPFAFILGGNGVTVGQVNGAALVGKALGFTVPGNQALSSALVTTGANPVLTSQYLLPQDPIHFLRDDWGHSDFDTPQRAAIDVIYDLPFAKRSRVLGGWEASSIITMESGQPYTIFAGPAFGEINQRVNLSGNLAVTGSPNGYFGTGGLSLVGTDSTACPAIYANPSSSPLFGGKPGLPGPCVGNTRRNQFYGPGFADTDLSLQKRFPVFGEGRSLHLRLEVFNLFNRSNFYNPISTLSTDGFTFNPQFGQILSAHSKRQTQLAARFDF